MYWILRAVVAFLFRVLTHVEVTGLEHVPARGPYILVTNHLSYLDPPLFMICLPARITVLAASKYKGHPFGLLLRVVDPIWIRRGEPDLQALRACVRLLAQGGVLGLAPEGTRSKTGALQQGKTGAAFLAVRARALLLPMVAVGTEHALQDLMHLRRPVMRCIIGEPFRLEMPARRGEDRLEMLTDEMMYRLAALLPPEYRGVYAAQPSGPGMAPRPAGASG